jgi:hypothetical protein
MNFLEHDGPADDRCHHQADHHDLDDRRCNPEQVQQPELVCLRCNIPHLNFHDQPCP